MTRSHSLHCGIDNLILQGYVFYLYLADDITSVRMLEKKKSMVKLPLSYDDD